MRAVAYARVSSAVQRDRDTIASQLRTLPEYIARMGWQLVKPMDTYVDDGRTAKAGHLEARTGLAALLRDAAAGVFDVVVVVDLDRLTRSEDITERGAILGAFQRAGVRVASAATGQVLDLSTSIGDLFGTLQTFFAAEENRKRRERIVQGKLTAIQRGKKPSGPTPYGLNYDRATGAWSINAATAPIVVEMFERVAAGETCVAIAEDFHQRGLQRPRSHWGRYDVWRIVRSRHVVGEWTVDKRRKLTISVPPIITEELWQRAQQALIRQGRRGLRRTKHTYLLEGLARCGECGAAILIRSATGYVAGGERRKNPAAYVCRARKLSFRGATRCTAPIVRVAAADDRVWAKLCELIRNPALIEAVLEQRRDLGDRPQDWQADAEGYRRRLAQIDRSESALLERFSRGKVSERALDLELDRLRAEQDALREQLKFATKAAVQAGDAQLRVDDAKATLARMAPLLPNASLALRRELVELFIRPGEVTLHEGEIRFFAHIPAVAAVKSRAVHDAAAPIALVTASFWERHHESDLRIRLVA